MQKHKSENPKIQGVTQRHGITQRSGPAEGVPGALLSAWGPAWGPAELWTLGTTGHSTSQQRKHPN